MALLFIEGFDNYGTTINAVPSPAGVMRLRTYLNWMSSETYARIVAGRLGGYAMLRGWSAASSTTCVRSTVNTDPTLVCGFAMKLSNLEASNIIVSFNYSTVAGVHIKSRSDGELDIYRQGSSSDEYVATSNGAGLTTDTWYYIELKVYVHATAGTYELRVNGVNVCSGGGVDTRPRTGATTYTYSHVVMFPAWTHTGNTIIIDDWYILNGADSVNSDFLGDSRVVTIRPDGEGDSTQFTPDSGSNYARVNEEVCDDDTSYVQDATANEKDLYTYGGLGGVLSSIAGIYVQTECLRTDATAFNIKTVCKSGVTESDGAAQTVPNLTYFTRSQIMETDPNTTGGAWTSTTLEAAQFGFKVG